MPVTQQDVIDTVVGKCTDENLRTEVWRQLADQHSDAARFYTWYRDNCGPDPGRRGAMLTGCDGDQTCMRERSMPASHWPRASTMTRSNDALRCGRTTEGWPSRLARFGVYTGVFLGSVALVFLCAMPLVNLEDGFLGWPDERCAQPMARNKETHHAIDHQRVTPVNLTPTSAGARVVSQPVDGKLLVAILILSSLGIVVAVALGAWLWGKGVKRRVRQMLQQQKYVFRFLANQHQAELRAIQGVAASQRVFANIRNKPRAKKDVEGQDVGARCSSIPSHRTYGGTT